ncbi:MAG: Undecaprenyl-diphosphatase [Flavobacteriaceae bacterium]|nr:MAG: Undecaprenyl-diphosphatase [Flavobacteriaceae bacterium]
MEWLSAFMLGVIQGLTEFLPVSSSGHLELTKILLGDSVPQEGLLLTLVLHTATALSTLIVFRKDILEILKGLVELKMNASWLFASLIVISMLPAAGIGLFFEEQVALLFEGRLGWVGVALVLTAVLLRLADSSKAAGNSLTPKNALVIGLAQAIAILPGISRSGATIATAVLLGVEREKAARFSFLMVIPLIFGSMFKSLLDVDFASTEVAYTPLFIGFITAFFTGILACRWMIALVKKSQLTYFAVYCLVVGLVAMSYEFFR